MLVTKMAKTATNILKLSPTHFVSNIRHQHRYSLVTVPIKALLEFKYQENRLVQLLLTRSRFYEASYNNGTTLTKKLRSVITSQLIKITSWFFEL